MLKYVEYAFLEMLGFLADDFLRRRSDGTDVHVASHHALGDSLGRGDTKHPGGVL